MSNKSQELTARSMDGVDMVRRLARVHQRVHSGQTSSSTARQTPEGVRDTGKGGQTGDKAGIESADSRHVESSRARTVKGSNKKERIRASVSVYMKERTGRLEASPGAKKPQTKAQLRNVRS